MKADTSTAPAKHYCVFTGSSPGARGDYRAAAADLGRELAERGLGLVYGGANVGCMGAIADASLAAGGSVTGVIPEALRDEVAHTGLTELRVCPTLHERKALMAELSAGFIALPGGLGTFEELFEVLTWTQLRIHAKPCAVLDVCDFFAPLAALLDHAVEERFLRPEHRSMLIVESDPAKLLDRIAAWQPVRVDKWMDRS